MWRRSQVNDPMAHPQMEEGTAGGAGQTMQEVATSPFNTITLVHFLLTLEIQQNIQNSSD